MLRNLHDGPLTVQSPTLISRNITACQCVILNVMCLLANSMFIVCQRKPVVVIAYVVRMQSSVMSVWQPKNGGPEYVNIEQPLFKARK